MTSPLGESNARSDLMWSTAVSGIPTLFAPREGPMTAGLFFRVGRADEPLALSGITHLVEHLALFGRDDGDIHHNGETSDTYTLFHVTGSEAEVIAFLNGVCRSLTELPLHRLEGEKEILRAEAAQRNSGIADLQRTERYGAAGPGTSSYGELGLHTVDAGEVQRWARERFTRGNAVLWITSDRIPVGLDLALPDGARRPVLDWQEVPRPRPGYFVGMGGAVLLDAIIPRSTAGAMFARITARALHSVLREQNAYSYSATCDYEPIDASRARVTLFADALPERQDAVVQGLVDVLDRMRAGAVDPRELALAADGYRRILETPWLGATLLPTSALNVLLGHPLVHPAALAQEAATVTAADIAEVARAVWADALAQIPAGTLDPIGFGRVPRWSASRVSGERIEVTGEPEFSLVFGDSGVSFCTPEGDATVLFSDCVGYLTRPDGARTLIGIDGFRVPIEPNVYYGIGHLVGRLDERLAHVAVPLPARTEEQIPAPRGRPMRWRGFGGWAWLVAALTLVALAIALPTTLAGSSLLAPMQVGRAWLIVVFLAVAAAVLIAGIRRRRNWRSIYGNR
jgi:predicted Zn-dependent peptidase